MNIREEKEVFACCRPAMSFVTRLPSAVLLEILFPFLPVGAAVLLLQTAHFQDLPRARFLAYVQTMKEHICYPFAAMFRSGISVPPLSFRHQPRVFLMHGRSPPAWNGLMLTATRQHLARKTCQRNVCGAPRRDFLRHSGREHLNDFCGRTAE